jgi:hypothetical protein
MTGLCALVLVGVPASATAKAPTPAARPTLAELENRLEERAAAVLQKEGTIRFFARHRWLLKDPRFRRTAHRRLAAAKDDLAAARARVATLRQRISDLKARNGAVRHRRPHRPVQTGPQPPRTRTRTPQAVICRVFGSRCHEALAVARCESRFRTDAQNGQYLGLFQMGDWARTTYGHGPSAVTQAKAAYRLFVATGRTWQQWSCKP